MRLTACVLAPLVLLLTLRPAESVAQPTPPAWVTQGPSLPDGDTAFTLPLRVAATKLYVEVTIGGKPRRFVFDTGSPSMLSRQVAEELGLPVVGTQRGTDSHGVIIESNIVQADLTLGGTTVHRVPMFVADFSTSPVARCLLGDGILGSEMLSLGAWQVDVPDAMLRFSTDARRLPQLRDATQVALYDFGYPHTPILDVRFASEATSKAMFDTGSPAYVAISPPDLAGAGRAGGVGRTRAGTGSAGSSLGGQAPIGPQQEAELASFAIGDLALGRVHAVARELPPTLIGASFLEHFVVTLDAPNRRAWFNRFRDGPFARPSFGFSLSFETGIAVSLVWEDSPASEAGLRPGLAIRSINGVTTAGDCAGIERAIDALAADSVDLTWDGGRASITRRPVWRER